LLGGKRQHALADLGQRLLWGASVGEMNRNSRRLLSHEPADAHGEELIQVRREAGTERQALEERQVLVACELEDARVEVEPGQLTVEEPFRPLDGGFVLLGDGHQTDRASRVASPFGCASSL
jgi:hypothetical protein